MQTHNPGNICLLGLGEVGNVLAADLGSLTGVSITVYDILFDDPDSAPSLAARATPAVNACESASAAATGAELIISAVTAAQDLNAAESVAAAMRNNAWFLDLNSVSPTTRAAVARVVDGAGGRYVEAAVMSPIKPKRAASPMLLGGPHAKAFIEVATGLGFSGARAFSDAIGLASATKMCRSVVVKGIESLLTEALLAARRYGVEDEVLESLRGLANNDDWEGFANYMISRSLEHGTRRAEEMREVAATIHDTGVDALMSRACAKRQDWAAATRIKPADDTLHQMLDAMLAHARED